MTLPTTLAPFSTVDELVPFVRRHYLSLRDRPLGEQVQGWREIKVIREMAQKAGLTAALPALGEADVVAGRMIGESLRVMAESGERVTYATAALSSNESLPDLASLGISKMQSSRWQSIAIIPDAAFEDELAKLLAAGKIPAPNHFERLGREIITKAKRQRRDAYRTPPESIDLRGGDFRKVLADLEPGSADLVFTDPPYPEEYLPLWGDLGRLAARILKPGGLLVAYCGQYHLWEVGDELRPHLKPWWVGAVIHDGAWTLISSRRIQTGWKPLLVFVNGERSVENWTDLVLAERRREKMGHAWEQNLAEAETVIAGLTEPGHLIVDPFAGHGTIPLAADRLGRRWIGAEIDQEAHAGAVRRIEKDRKQRSQTHEREGTLRNP